MQIAVIKSGGKQYLVKPGDKIKIEKIKNKNKLIFDDILFGKKAEAKILRNGRYKKVIIFKYKPKKRYHKKQGHRQEFTEIEIIKINGKKDYTQLRKKMFLKEDVETLYSKIKEAEKQSNY